MPLQSRKIFTVGAAILILITCSVFAADHHKLNGTWILVPPQTSIAGEASIQAGTITINDREGNVFISRTFTYDRAPGTETAEFSTDGRENSSVRDGKHFRSKAKWEGDVLQATTTQDDVTTVERYTLMPDGRLMVGVERPGHPILRLYFQRQ